MSDSFFGFDTNLETDPLEVSIITDEEEDYDALNDETFGEDVFSGDWEEDHEKSAELIELSRHGVKPENGEFNNQFASLLLDEEPVTKRNEVVDNVKPVPRPPPGFWINNTQPPPVKPPLPILKNVCTVEEIERNLIKPPSTSLRLEDLEKKLIYKPNPPGLNVRPVYNNMGIQATLRQGSLASSGSLPKLRFPQFQIQAPPPLLIMSPGLMRAGIGPLQPPRLYVRVPLTMGGSGRGAPPIVPLSNRPPLPEDEYAGLMTPKEKQFLASIQLMQLSTSTPFQDDYYYLMYHQRQSGHHGRKLGCPLKTQRDIQTVNKPAYTPLQFENSLGKLQVGSVMAPRKIIDTDIVESIECTTQTTTSQKVKQILLEIEHMFSDVLTAEEALSPLACLKTDEPAANQLFTKTVNSLLKNDKLKTVLNIRKGKTLVLRLLSHLEVSDPLAAKLIAILPCAAQKDSEQVMLRALPAIRHYLSSAELPTLVSLLTNLQPHFLYLLSNKFGISVITNMIERAEAQMSQLDSENEEWLALISELLLVSSRAEKIERPVVGIPGSVLSRHFSRCKTANNQHIAILQKALSNLNIVDKF